jgi:hypothetical protein
MTLLSLHGMDNTSTSNKQEKGVKVDSALPENFLKPASKLEAG